MQEIRPLDRRHNSAMLEILHQSPAAVGGLTLCFDRQPDIFKMPELKYDPPVWNGVFENGQLMGFGLAGYHKAFVNGDVRPVMHVTDCYFRPEARGQGYFYSAFPEFLKRGAASLGYAVRLEGVRGSTMDRKFSTTRAGISMKFLGELTVQSLVLLFSRKKRSQLPVRRARMDDIGDIVALLRDEHKPRLFGLAVDGDQFAAQLNERPGLSIDDYYVVEQGGKLAGVCALWDTSSFKQDRVVQYGLGLNIVRMITRAAWRPSGFPGLPAPGEPFRNIFFTDWAARGRSLDVLRALMEHGYHEARSRGYFSLIFGSCSQDPLLEATRGCWVDTIRFAIVAMALDRKWIQEGALDTRLPFVDLAMF